MDTEKTREELETELEKCKFENQAKSEFLSMVTHQLRTPLSGTKWTFKMLLDGDLGSFSEEQRQIITKGSESNQRMIDLLNEVIVANQNQSWDFQYDMQKTDVEKLVERIITEYLETARAHDVHLVFNRSEQASPMIMADPDKIAIILQNLLENAIKYSNEEGTVTVTIIPTKDTLAVSVADNGIGIPADAQEHIFGKFFRADNAKESKKEGTGLGLFTAKRIAEKHGGTLTFESTPSQGTTFFVQLPVYNS